MTGPTALLDPPDDHAVNASVDEVESAFATDSERVFYGDDVKKTWEQVALVLFIAIPFLAVVAAVPVMWGWGLGWRDAVNAFVMYAVTGHGITVGFHRYFTHGSYKAKRLLRVAMAVAGSMAIEGPVILW